MLDVAERSGVSRTTVSMALRNHPKARTFNPETVRRIREAARDLGYRTNFFSSQLRRDAAQVIMLYLDSIQDLYAGAIVESMQQRAAQRGYWTMVSIASDPDVPVFDSRIIGDHGVSAIALIASLVDRVDVDQLQALTQQGVRAVVVGRDKPCEGISETAVDDYRGGWLAAEHVYGLGARRVWIMGRRPFTKTLLKRRHDAVYDYAKSNHLPEPEFIQCETVPGVDGPLALREMAYAAVRKRLASGDELPDAILAHHDLYAMGVYGALFELGKTPGRDVAVVGYDDIWPAQMMCPSLTTIHQPTREMGATAADLLIDCLEGGIRPGRQVSVEPELVARDSTNLWSGKS